MQTRCRGTEVQMSWSYFGNKIVISDQNPILLISVL